MAGRALTVLRLGSLVSRSLPLGWLIRLAEWLGPRLGPRLMPTKSKQLHRHLERVGEHRPAGGPELAVADAAIAARNRDADNGGPASDQMRRGFGSYARYWVESFRIPYLSDRQIDRGFSFVGYDKIEAVRAAGYGPILVLPHIGGWEWAAAWLGRIAKVNVTAVVERLEPEEVFEWFSRLRQAFGVHVVPLGPTAMAELVASAKRRDIICLLSDRDIGGNGLEVSFFGETTTLPVGPALLARRTGSPLMPVAVLFRGRQRICLVGDPIWPAELGAAKGGVDGKLSGRALNQALTQEVANRLEELVGIAPDQWHMLEPNWPSDSASDLAV